MLQSSLPAFRAVRRELVPTIERMISEARSVASTADKYLTHGAISDEELRELWLRVARASAVSDALFLEVKEKQRGVGEKR
jgi:hypothetical protein